MSADVLRRAAEGMRGEYETDPYRLGQTMRAVADWLDATRRTFTSHEVYRAAIAVARAYLGESG